MAEKLVDPYHLLKGGLGKTQRSSSSLEQIFASR